MRGVLGFGNTAAVWRQMEGGADAENGNTVFRGAASVRRGVQCSSAVRACVGWALLGGGASVGCGRGRKYGSLSWMCGPTTTSLDCGYVVGICPQGAVTRFVEASGSKSRRPSTRPSLARSFQAARRKQATGRFFGAFFHEFIFFFEFLFFFSLLFFPRRLRLPSPLSSFGPLRLETVDRHGKARFAISVSENRFSAGSGHMPKY